MTDTLRTALFCCILPLCAGIPGLARAVEVFRCTRDNGATSYPAHP